MTPTEFRGWAESYPPQRRLAEALADHDLHAIQMSSTAAGMSVLLDHEDARRLTELLKETDDHR